MKDLILESYGVRAIAGEDVARRKTGDANHRSRFGVPTG
jgi:hypothetical protein